MQGYDCVSTGTQEMPPSWTDNTDPNVDFDTKGRAYQVTLPFNAFWEGGLHPNAEVDVSYSDDMGQHWIRGNGGKPLEPTNNQKSVTLGHVEDKQWVARANVRMSEFSWDPEQPGQHVGGVSQYPCAGHTDPCPNGGGFIGDYFGLAVSDENVYGLFVSTHYRSAVTADEGGTVYYQQQVLATVPRSTFGAGY